jgi:hypothetical protein
MKKLGYLLLVLLLYSTSYSQLKVSTHSIKVNQGWNLLSLPATVTDSLKTLLFPNAASSAFVYDNGYFAKDTLQHGYGFWVKFNAEETISISGYTAFDDTLIVKTGWNIIGSLSMPIAVNTIKSEPGGIIASQFYTFNNGYKTVDTIQPGLGYWVKVNQNGKIILQDANTIIGRVAVDTTEIGGSNIKLVSCFSDGIPSSTDTLSTRVSSEGNQFLLAIDGENKLRALTLSSYQNSNADILKLDATGTATALIFVSPGILTTDTSEFYPTISKITSLSSFNEFRDYLSQRLIALSLNEIIVDSLYDSILVNCILEYIELHPLKPPFDKIQKKIKTVSRCGKVKKYLTTNLNF